MPVPARAPLPFRLRGLASGLGNSSHEVVVEDDVVELELVNVLVVVVVDVEVVDVVDVLGDVANYYVLLDEKSDYAHLAMVVMCTSASVGI